MNCENELSKSLLRATSVDAGAGDLVNRCLVISYYVTGQFSYWLLCWLSPKQNFFQSSHKSISNNETI